MKRSPIVTAICAACIGGAAVLFAADPPKAPKGPTTKPSTTQAKAKTPINKFCAVDGGDHEVDPKVTYEYKGKTVGFCCADCIDEFKKDPEKYMKKLK